MRTEEAIPRTAPDLSDLAALVQRPGPSLTVYLGTDPAVVNAGARSEQRWRACRQDLAERGAPEDVLAAVDPLVPEAHLSGSMLAVVADKSGVLLSEHHDDVLDRDRATWSRLPDLAPLIRARQSDVPYVLVMADRGGGDLVAGAPGRPEIEATAGDGEPERKVHPGGWSQRRFQQRAEEDWAATARQVAEEVERLVDEVDARVVALGGDVRAVGLIRDDLPARMADRVQVIEHGRASDGSEGLREAEVRRLVATAVAQDTVALLERFREEIGQDDQAVAGTAATVDALNRGAVEVLFVHDGEHSDDDPHAWIGAEPLPVARRRDDDVAALIDEPEQARLPDALIRAALGTGAAIRIIPKAGPVDEGVGGLLRWASGEAS